MEIKHVKGKNVQQHRKLSAEKKKRAENHNACKKRYYEAVKSAEAATINLDAGKSQNLPDKHIQKLDRSKSASLKSVEVAHATYQKSVEELKAAQVTFDNSVADMLQEFELLEKKRLASLQEQGKRYANSHDFLKSAIEQIAVLQHEGANAAKVDEDIQAFLKANKTGASPPEHITYQPCVSEVIGHMTEAKSGSASSIPSAPVPAAPHHAHPPSGAPASPSIKSLPSSAPAPPPIGGPVSAPIGNGPSKAPSNAKQEYARALFEFESSEPDDLPFPLDAIIKLTNAPDSEDWWQGEYKGKTGMFPKNYVKKQSEAESSSNASPQKAPGGAAASAPESPKVMNARCEALFDFDGQDSDDLSFRVGDILIITGELDGWFLGKTLDGAKTGIFPSNYVKITSGR
jgi:hypothetical protein